MEGLPWCAVVKNLPPMQGTWVRALVRKDPTCREQLSPCIVTTEPMHHNY